MFLVPIDPAGRALGGGLVDPSVLPKKLPESVLALEELPAGPIPDYRWDGAALVYDPLPAPSQQPVPDPAAEASALEILAEQEYRLCLLEESSRPATAAFTLLPDQPQASGAVSALCRLLIRQGRTAGLSEKIQLFRRCGRLSETEYQELAQLLQGGDSIG